jgi:hypothetical protein
MPIAGISMGLGLGGGTSATSSGEPPLGGTERIPDGTFGAVSPVTINSGAVNRKVRVLGTFASSHGLGNITTGTILTIHNVNLSTNFGIRLIQDNSTPYCYVNVSGYPYAAGLTPSLTVPYLYDSAANKYVASGVGTVEFVGTPQNWTLLDNGQAGSGVGYPIDYYTDGRSVPNGVMQSGVKSDRWGGRMAYVTSAVAGNKMRGTGWEIADLAPTNWTLSSGYSDYNSLVAGNGLAKAANIQGPTTTYTFSSPLASGTYSVGVTRGDSGSNTLKVETVGPSGDMNVTWSGGSTNGQTIHYNNVVPSDTISFTSTSPVHGFRVNLSTDGQIVTGVSVVG